VPDGYAPSPGRHSWREAVALTTQPLDPGRPPPRPAPTARLRKCPIVRRLAGSPHARNLRRLGQSELKRLLKGADIEQDLLALLTAARGGLSGTDLNDLTCAELAEIEDVLHTVARRTFTRRVSTWDPDTGPEVYLLGHDELHNAATQYVGSARLNQYRARLLGDRAAARRLPN
jgi:hypothetical protein